MKGPVAQGFTLIELMVGITLTAVLSIILALVIGLAIWGTYTVETHRIQAVAENFASDVYDAHEVICIGGTYNVPCTVFHKDGKVISIECTAAKCSVVPPMQAVE